MLIIGVDYHPSFQQIAFVDTDTGELEEHRLQHCEEAEKFYRDRATHGVKVRVGMEARWAGAVVGASAGGAELGIVDWRRHGDPGEASRQEEDRSRRCSAYSALAARGSFFRVRIRHAGAD